MFAPNQPVSRVGQPLGRYVDEDYPLAKIWEPYCGVRLDLV